MRIAVLGATGATGRGFAERARSRGHEISVLVRDAAPYNAPDGAEVIVGDATNRADILRVARDADAVFSSLGLTAAGTATQHVDVCAAATAHLILLMESGSPRRLIAMSTHGVGLSPEASPYARRVWDLYAERLKDKVDMERLLRASSIDWLAIRAPRITDDDPAPAYRHGADLDIKPGGSIPRTNLIDFALQQIETPTLSQQAVSVSL